MLRLCVASSSEWLATVLADFDAFLQDHANCERKASATAMSLVTHYADRLELVDAMIGLAREELTHFEQVYGLMAARGLLLAPVRKDPYIQALHGSVRRGREEYFLDRLLLGAVVEARGCERFGLIAEALPGGPLRAFYADLTRSEARHHVLFLRVARAYFDAATVSARLAELLGVEAKVVPALPLRPALH